jgi:acetylglutamate/LysW-gamma-L-alpha-aminoadipate kinase
VSGAVTIVVKAGGSAGIDREAIAADIAALASTGERIVLVHGASSETDALADSLGHPARTVISASGQQSRRTDRRTLEIFAMAALGKEMLRYVELLRRHGASPIGLFGALGATRKNVRALQGDRTVLLRDDYTGKLERIDAELLRTLQDRGHVPVLPPLALSADGEALNVDGDRAAALVAGAMGARTLLILTNVPGILRSTDDPSSVVDSATVGEADALVTGRMRKKTLAAREALAAGVAHVRIASGAIESPVRRALAGGGTALTETAPELAGRQT